MPAIVSSAKNLESAIVRDVAALEHRVHNAISQMDSVIVDHCCAKLSHMVCPAFIRKFRARKQQRDSVQANLSFSKGKDNVFSQRFDMIFGAFILANSLLMLVQLEYQGYQSEVSLGEREADGWSNADTYFTIAEHIFNAIFILELIMRFAMDGAAIFCDGSIILDMFLVCVSSAQIYIMDPMDVEGIPGVNLSLFRMLRFFKFIKIFRLVRVLKLFTHLRVLVKTIVSSFGALVWSMILLLVIMILSGMFLCGLLEGFITNPENDLTQRKWVFKYYGTAGRAIYTLFEVTLAGCWPNYIRPLIDHVSAWYILFAVLYISMVVFAIIRIITAIFLKETLLIAGADPK
jgi:hypothetical protein